MKLSVIIPAYKVAPFLPACLKSLEREKLSDAEFLVVDDGSPDAGADIARDFAARDNRFRLLQKENGGLSDARNFGLDRAAGDAIFFLDGDDALLPGVLPKMLSRLEETGADLVLCHVRYAWENGKTRDVSAGFSGIAEGEETKPLLTRLYPAAWNKLYRRESIGDLRFPKGLWFEDVAFYHCLFPRVRIIASVDEPGVLYRQREGSITARPDPKLFDYLAVVASFCDYYAEKGLLSDWEEELSYCAARYLLATFCKRAARLPGTQPREAAERSLAFLNERFPQWRESPYMTGPRGFYLKHFSASWMPLLRSIK